MEYWLFGDESGNFDFSVKGTHYFMVGTLLISTSTKDSLRNALATARDDLLSEGISHSGGFHATEDRQAVRNKVFEQLADHSLRMDVTILDKHKAYPHIHTSDEIFYKYAWFYHLRYLLQHRFRKGDRVNIILSDIGTKKKRQAFQDAITDVINQCCPPGVIRTTAFWNNSAEECLQVTDYLLWAVARKIERNDDRSYRLIDHLVKTAFDLFAQSNETYY